MSYLQSNFKVEYFVGMLLPHKKDNTTDYSDLHRLKSHLISSGNWNRIYDFRNDL